jgi:hypothetical protein
MSDLRKYLQAGDPLNAEPGLTREEVQRMRRAVLAGASGHSRTTATLVFTLGACLATTVAAGLWLVRPTPTTRSDTGPSPLAAVQSPEPRTDRRQLLFATPGGTRVIWVFDPNFDLR